MLCVIPKYNPVPNFLGQLLTVKILTKLVLECIINLNEPFPFCLPILHPFRLFVIKMKCLYLLTEKRICKLTIYFMNLRGIKSSKENKGGSKE